MAWQNYFVDSPIPHDLPKMCVRKIFEEDYTSYIIIHTRYSVIRRRAGNIERYRKGIVLGNILIVYVIKK
jgi:hypothetical protein